MLSTVDVSEQERLAEKACQEVEKELDKIEGALPELMTNDADLLVLDESLAPADRLRQMRAGQIEMLRRDMPIWLEEKGQSWIPVVDDLLAHGWLIHLKSGAAIQREWHQLISMAFVEELKGEQRLRAVFESRILAELKNRDNRLAQVSEFAGFQQVFDSIMPPLQQMEKGINEIRNDVSAIRNDVSSIDGKIETLRGESVPWWARALAVLTGIGAVGGAVLYWSLVMPEDSQTDLTGPKTNGNIEVKSGERSPVITNSRTGDLTIQYGAENSKPKKER
jgi:hypothetical protein